jgi:hypothetical protein
VPVYPYGINVEEQGLGDVGNVLPALYPVKSPAFIGDFTRWLDSIAFKPRRLSALHIVKTMVL